MRQALVVGAIACAAVSAQAQSSVTLFGIVDATLQHGSGGISNRTQLGSNGLATTRVGFRGVEDLGGGNSASFWLEAGLNADNGSGQATSINNQVTGATGGGGVTFNRRSTVSLAGDWGELRLGRDFSVQYYNHFAFDPFGNNGVGTSQTLGLGGPVASRVSNAIMYFLPSSLGGLYGEVQAYLGENASNAGASADDGTGGGIRLGYRVGNLNMAAAHARTRYAQSASAGDIATSNLGARYDMGNFSLMAGYYRDRVDALAGLTGRGFQVGALYRVGSGEFRASVSGYKTTAAGDPATRKIAIGYVHDLSKRTALYATYARVRNSGGASFALNGASTGPNQSSSGLDVGVRHSF